LYLRLRVSDLIHFASIPLLAFYFVDARDAEGNQVDSILWFAIVSFMNSFNDFYYSFSPYIADYERENPLFREMVKIAITPMISSLSILNYMDMSSDQEVLGYGISLILLNISMYFAAPVIIIYQFRNKIK